MGLTLASILLLAAVPAQAEEDFVWPLEAVQRLQDCGFAEVSTYYSNDLDDDVIVIDDDTASDGQLECAAGVYLASHYWIEMDPTFQDPFYAHYRRLAADFARQESLSELEARGEIGMLPEYRPGETDDSEFALKLEMLCGEDAEGALQSQFGPHSISPEWANEGLGSIDAYSEALECISRFAGASGFQLYLVGSGVTAVAPSSSE